jgi:hypothetical protein
MPGKHFTYFVHPRKGHGLCAEEEGFIRQTLDEKLQELCRGQ